MFLFTFYKKKMIKNHVIVDDSIQTVHTYEMNGTTYVIDAETKKLLGFGVGQRNTIITSVLQGENNG